MLIIIIYKALYISDTATNLEYEQLFERISGFGLGGSMIALFGRVGGGIYTKAADVGADLAGKVVKGLPEDDIRNPGVIADNVGDNVGDIAGMGSDLFGSLAESSCAALVVSGTSVELIAAGGAFYYPLMITAGGVLVSIVTYVLVFCPCFRITKFSDVEKAIKWQIILSTVIMIPVLAAITEISLPDTFSFPRVADVSKWEAFACTATGLVAGFLIGMVTEYYTSNEYGPVKNLADSCKTGAATNIIQGLALGYMSTVIPVLALAITIYVAFYLADMYGVALAALGMLSTLCISLSIDGYGPISDNAGGIAEMVGLELTRRRTDRLDAAGNTTAAIGKGFAIGSACLVAIALFGAFATRTNVQTIEVLQPLQFAGLILGAMLPYFFSAFTVKAVGSAAGKMIEEIARQDREGLMREGSEPEYEKCVEISTTASLKEMIAPGLLVLLAPIFVGLLFGPEGVAGVLTGSIVSGVQLAISSSNSGGGWDNAKKYIEAGGIPQEVIEGAGINGEPLIVDHKKHSETHKAAVVGDTVGDPLKDTSGPSLNILIKLMAILSLVFGSFFMKTGYLA